MLLWSLGPHLDLLVTHACHTAVPWAETFLTLGSFAFCRAPRAPRSATDMLFYRTKTGKTGVHDAAEFVLRHKLFDELLKKEEFMDAANCLGKLNLDSTSGGKVCVCRFRHLCVLDWGSCLNLSPPSSLLSADNAVSWSPTNSVVACCVYDGINNDGPRADPNSSGRELPQLVDWLALTGKSTPPHCHGDRCA